MLAEPVADLGQEAAKEAFAASLHDRMTECVYAKPIST
jgi:hypothetical protein